jgi:transposase
MQSEIEVSEQDRTVVTTPGAIFFSMELSRSKWLLTSLAPGGEKMSRYVIDGGDIAGLMDRLPRSATRRNFRPASYIPSYRSRRAALMAFGFTECS